MITIHVIYFMFIAHAIHSNESVRNLRNKIFEAFNLS